MLPHVRGGQESGCRVCEMASRRERWPRPGVSRRLIQRLPRRRPDDCRASTSMSDVLPSVMGRCQSSAIFSSAPIGAGCRLARRRRRRRGDFACRSDAGAGPQAQRHHRSESGFALRFRPSRPPRVHASVRGQRKAANIMPGPVRSRAPISQACSNASVRRRGNTRRLGDRVPVGTWDGRRLRARPQPSASSRVAVGAHAVAPERQAAPAAGGRVRRKSAPSTHIRCRITPIRRAMATTARFIPRRRATCRPQAFSQHGLA